MVLFLHKYTCIVYEQGEWWVIVLGTCLFRQYKSITFIADMQSNFLLSSGSFQRSKYLKDLSEVIVLMLVM